MFVRNQVRGAGVAYRRALRVPLTVPLLSVHGKADKLVPVAAMAGAEAYVHARHELVSLIGVGHLPHEEAPEEFNRVLLSWLAAGP
jgi:pimeloyl-ACP methyl ester carboxylesterase